MAIRDAQQFFDSYAHDFAAIYSGQRPLAWRLVDRWLRRSMFLRYKQTLLGCRPIEGATLLDVGCGPGHYTVALAQMGAASVTGIDVSGTMIEAARNRAREAGVADRCRFERVEYLSHPFDQKFDFIVLMGFMDYVSEPKAVVAKTLALARRRAFFSFPRKQGLLAWQRRLRYRGKTDLYMYSRADIERLFAGRPAVEIRIDRIARDYFVTATAPA
jgi:2-polyprenyl-3-methyl-5-hydroxy-6-metoxy-1,4-benzoquinol methylase